MADCDARITYVGAQGSGPATSLSFRIDTAPCLNSRGSFDFEAIVDQGARGQQTLRKTEAWRANGASTTQVNYSVSLTDEERVKEVNVVGTPQCTCD